MSDGYMHRGDAGWEPQAAHDIDPQSWDLPGGPARSVGFREGFAPSPKLVLLSRTGGIQAESIGSLRSHLQANHMRDGRRSLAVCAATPGVGTSFVAANLAVSLAIAGANTLLIDGNLRAPSLHDYIVPDRRLPGLRDYLADNRLGADDIIQDAVMPNLSMIYSSAADGDAQRLLASRKLDELFDSAMRDYDVTIVDTPPSGRFGDARRIAAELHHAMVVTRKSHSYVGDVRTLVEDFKSDRVNVIGSFLNDFSDAKA